MYFENLKFQLTVFNPDSYFASKYIGILILDLLGFSIVKQQQA